MPSGAVDTVIFDLGGVLIDWDPRYLYRTLFVDDEPGMERFLAEVANAAWNGEMDGGKPFAEGVAELIARHPHERERIEAYHARWLEMIGGPIHGTVAILEDLAARGVPLYAITNWSAETFALTRREPAYAFLDLFREILRLGRAAADEARARDLPPRALAHRSQGAAVPVHRRRREERRRCGGGRARGPQVHDAREPRRRPADARAARLGAHPRAGSTRPPPARPRGGRGRGRLAWSSLPQVSGELRVAGLAGPVEVVRDRWGVPHIRAGSAEDAYRALGFVHAQDRLWQMEFNRRVGQGRLAEILGRDALPFDRLMRTLDLRGAAEASVEHLGVEARQMLEAYAGGVNAFLRSGARLPPEFLILRDDARALAAGRQRAVPEADGARPRQQLGPGPRQGPPGPHAHAGPAPRPLPGTRPRPTR